MAFPGSLIDEVEKGSAIDAGGFARGRHGRRLRAGTASHREREQDRAA
jgi:hypothetical protein